MATWFDAIRTGVWAAVLPTVEPTPVQVADGPSTLVSRGAVDSVLGYGRAVKIGGKLRGALVTQGGYAGGMLSMIEPAAPENAWRDLNLDDRALDRMPVHALLELLSDISPEISKALWDFLRMVNPGWTYDTSPPSARPTVEAFLGTIKRLYGSVDVVLNAYSIMAFLRGAFYGECVLGRDGLPCDLAAPDPIGARFKKVEHPDRGDIWQLGQVVGGQWQSITAEQVKYIPVDPFPNNPYGRSIGGPALFISIFLLALLHDLRRVIQQQGWPRLDISVDLAGLKDEMPAAAQTSPAEWRAWVQKVINDVAAVYDVLQPDDAYIHTSSVKVNRAVGTVDANSLSAIGPLMSALERMIIRALKTMPLLLGVNESAGENSANRQWEVHAAGIKSIQHLSESLIEYLLSIMLQASGVVGSVTFRFAELRASEEMRDAQVEEIKIRNAVRKYLMGWVNQDEAARSVTGNKADVAEPRYLESGLTTPAGIEAAAEATAQNEPPGPDAKEDTEPDDGAAVPDTNDQTDPEVDRLMMPLLRGPAGEMLRRIYHREKEATHGQ